MDVHPADRRMEGFALERARGVDEAKGVASGRRRLRGDDRAKSQRDDSKEEEIEPERTSRGGQFQTAILRERERAAARTCKVADCRTSAQP